MNFDCRSEGKVVIITDKSKEIADFEIIIIDNLTDI